MKILHQHVQSVISQFDPVKTDLKAEQVTGAQRKQTIAPHNVTVMLPIMSNTLVRNFLTKADNGTINIHQLTSFYMPTYNNRGNPFLTVFLQHAMSEGMKVNPFNQDRITFFNGNNGAIQRVLHSLVNQTGDYNTVFSNATSVSNNLVPIAHANWDNVEDNKEVFMIFNALKEHADKGEDEMVENLWKAYELLVQKQVADNKLINSAVFLADSNSLITGKVPFPGMSSSNPLWDASKLYGSGEWKTSYFPYTAMFNGTVEKIEKSFVEKSMQSLVKTPYTFGYRTPNSSKGNAKKANENMDEFDPAAMYMDDTSDNNGNASVYMANPDVAQVYSGLLGLSDSNGRDSLCTITISDVKPNEVNKKLIKRTTSYESVKTGSFMLINNSPIIPRSLNGGISKGVIGLGSDGVLYGTLGISFELIKVDYEVKGSSLSGGVVSIDTSSGNLLVDSLLSVLDVPEETVLVDTGLVSDTVSDDNTDINKEVLF